jgi:uncharacterized protein YigA (DUF484 family)
MADATGSEPIGAKPAAPPLAAAAVADYLRQHPDFLAQHSDLIQVLVPPDHRHGDNVVDMQQFMVAKLQDQILKLQRQQRALITTSRANLSSQQRIHGAVLTLIGAQSFETLLQTVTTDFAVALDVDVITLCIEARAGITKAPLAGLQLLEEGEVDRLLGVDREVRLGEDIDGDPRVFGGGAGLVRSEALLRLDIAKAPPGILAMGSRKSTRFRVSQGTELLGFLASALEITIAQWLDL